MTVERTGTQAQGAAASARRQSWRARVPEGSVVYAVGDIHGRSDLLDRLHGLIRADAQRRAAARRVVVYLGDYVDRGPDSRGVIDRLAAASPDGFETVCLMGNHEAVLQDFLEDPRAGPLWMRFGGRATLESYGICDLPVGDDPEAFAAAQAALRERMPPLHRAWLAALRPCHVEGDYVFVHAGVRPGVPLDRQSLHDMLWIRDEFLNADADFGKVVVHGHTPVPRPVVRWNRIGIDTGAYASGVLTALVLEGSSRAFLQT